MRAFAGRNLKLYFRDKAAVLFSLLGVLIIIGLYVLFLGDIYTTDLEGINKAGEWMDNWVMAGVLAVTSVTTTLGILGNMVKDRVIGISKDFFAAPVKRSHILGGYMASAYLVGVLMTFFALLTAEIYIAAKGGDILSLPAFCKVSALIFLTSFMNTSMVLLLVSFFKSMSAYTSAGTVIGALIGFITGIYLPIGMYPSAVRWIIKIFPASHAALLFRNIMMNDLLSEVSGQIPAGAVLEIKTNLGMVYSIGDKTIPETWSAAYLIICGIIFTGLTCFYIRRKWR